MLDLVHQLLFFLFVFFFDVNVRPVVNVKNLNCHDQGFLFEGEVFRPKGWTWYRHPHHHSCILPHTHTDTSTHTSTTLPPIKLWHSEPWVLSFLFSSKILTFLGEFFMNKKQVNIFKKLFFNEPRRSRAEGSSLPVWMWDTFLLQLLKKHNYKLLKRNSF